MSVLHLSRRPPYRENSRDGSPTLDNDRFSSEPMLGVLGGDPPTLREQGLLGSARTLWKLQTALEKAGVEFIPEDDVRGPGVRLRKSTRSKARRKLKSSG